MVVLYHFEDGMPVFGEVKDIIVIQLKECLFVLYPLVADYYDRHIFTPTMFHLGIIRALFIDIPSFMTIMHFIQTKVILQLITACMCV